MNKLGKIKNTWNKIKSSYPYKLINRVISFFFTVILIFLLVIGALMFYFNMKAKSAIQRGVNYVPPFGMYTIISGSMEPQIKVYDVVIVQQVKNLNTLKVGDVITFVSNWKVNYGDTITHRIVSIKKNDMGEFQFTTKGDFNNVADGAPVTQNNLIGKVVIRLPQLGKLQFFLATKMGWFMAIFIPALIVIIVDIVKIAKLLLLKKKIINVKNTDECKKTYFGNELLETRTLSDSDLMKTTAINKININTNESENTTTKERKKLFRK